MCFMKEVHINLQRTNQDKRSSMVHLQGNGQRSEVLDLLMQGTFTYLSSEFPSVDPMLSVRMYCHALENLAKHYTENCVTSFAKA